MNPFSAENYLEHFETVLQAFFEKTDLPAEHLKKAIGHALFSGGKRIRPLLIYLTGKLLDIPLKACDIMATGIELMHTYSLIHDDLPAMDDDDFRRGLPTCHRAFDEATAILAGDALQSLGIEQLIECLPEIIGSKKTLDTALILLKASGASGMVSGQSLDLSELSKENLGEASLRNIHALKTGRLFSACVDMPLATTVASPEQTKALRDFAVHLGLVFQMQDDYLDAWHSKDVLGKGAASDEKNHKSTFASLYTQKDLQKLVDQQFEMAISALSIFGEKAMPLVDFVHRIQARSQSFSSRHA